MLRDSNTFFYFNEYYYFVVFTFVSFFFTILLLLLTKFFTETSVTFFFKDQVSPYECGFIPYDDARGRFEVHFYIVALLFVIFDIEIILILPWIIGGAYTDSFSFIIVFMFFFILGIGFVYEWLRGAINWFFVID